MLRQSWLNLSFLHWAVDPASIAHLYPPDTEPDVFDGRSYVGLVPFQMSLYGRFLETNVRLYSVDATGRRGVVFLSLDTERPAMVAFGRWLVGVPYRWATMTYAQVGQRYRYTSVLRWPRTPASIAVEVEVAGPLACGPLEHYVTARWGAHVVRGGRTWYMPNEHPAWALRRADVISLEENGLFASVGLGDLAARPPDHVAFSRGVAARFGRPVLATTPRAQRTS